MLPSVRPVLGKAALVLALALAAPAASAPAAAAPVDRFEVAANPQPVAHIRIKGTDLTVRIALGFDKAMLLNLAPATKARLKAFPLIGKQTFKSNL
ncbi:MAG: hypothetical protein H7243_02145, partial [Sphingomonadaceae bacterium]|nr:hypothetical protein [Sphingomonadaceae bacterium]